MQRLSITVIFCLLSFSLLSQKSKIENTRVDISLSTDTMNVKYDLKGKREANIILEVTDLNNIRIQPKNIDGDIGKNIHPGIDKTIIWDMNADGLDLSGSSLKVKVKGAVFIQTVKKKIKYLPPKWGCGLTISSGYGIFTSDLARTYRYMIPIVADFDIYYKRLALYLRDYIGISETLLDIPYSGGTWVKGSRTDIIHPEASLGYILAFNKTITFAPFAGIGATEIGPTEDDLKNTAGLNEVKLEFTTTYSLGLNLDFKFGPSGNQADLYGLRWSFVFIKLKYSYNITHFDNTYPGFGGNIHTLTLGIGVFGGRGK
jgi:hypothetical protein